jgi:hypothetical protein
MVHPEGWRKRVLAIVAETGNPPQIANFFDGNEALPAWVKVDKLAVDFDDDGRVTRLALAIEEELHPDLLMVLLPGIDRVSHWLWGNLAVGPEGFVHAALRIFVLGEIIPSARCGRSGL